MTSYVPIVAGFLVSLVAVGLARRAALAAGKLDVPTDRSSHSVPTPRTGGFGIAAGLAVAWAAIALLDPGGGLAPLAAGAFLFFVVGALDDLRGLSPRTKLALQAVAAVVPVAMGLRLDLAAWGAWPGLELGPLSGVATVVWLLVLVNAVNFMDGIDGITSATALAVLVAAGVASSGPVSLVSLSAAAAVLGFVPWNWPPARVFMGDGGSHLLGFLCAAGGLAVAGTEVAPWPIVLAALLPSVIDVAGALVTKARRGIPLAQAHNDHRYQRLVKAGRGHGVVALRYGAVAACLAAAAGPVAARWGPGVGAGAGALQISSPDARIHH